MAPSTSTDALTRATHGQVDGLERTRPTHQEPTTPPRPLTTDRAALVRDLFIRARDARRDVTAAWKGAYRALNNRPHRPGADPWDEEPAISSIWPTIASGVAWMTDQRPTIEVTPTADAFSDYWQSYQDLAQAMNVCLNAAFTTHLLDAEISKVLWDVHTYRVGYFKTTWEHHLADGLGDAAFRRVDPFTLYPDPHARTPEDASYFIEARQMTLSALDRAWPGAARKVRNPFPSDDTESGPHLLDSQVNDSQPRDAFGALAPSTQPVGYRHHATGSGHQPTDDPVVTVLEAWVRDHKVTPSNDPRTAKVDDEWRCIVVCGNQVLLDEASTDITAHGGHPYDRMVLLDTGEWYGPGMVEKLAPIQRIIDWLLGALNRNIYLAGNPVLVEDPRAASRNRRFTNRPGQRLEGTPATTAWMSPPQIHPQMSVELIRYYEGKIETISGLSAMVRGFSPTGRNSEGVLDSVQDAAFVRVRATLRELERALRGVAGKMAATIAEFYIEPRLLSLIGPDGQRTFLSLQARQFYVTDADDRGKRIPMRFNLAADAGSQLPTSKQARAGEAKTLFKLGVIDEYEVLKASQWPNYALVAQRVAERNAQAAASKDKK